jgi:hypothetical protein
MMALAAGGAGGAAAAGLGDVGGRALVVIGMLLQKAEERAPVI